MYKSKTHKTSCKLTLSSILWSICIVSVLCSLSVLSWSYKGSVQQHQQLQQKKTATHTMHSRLRLLTRIQSLVDFSSVAIAERFLLLLLLLLLRLIFCFQL